MAPVEGYVLAVGTVPLHVYPPLVNHTCSFLPVTGLLTYLKKLFSTVDSFVR